MSTKSLLVMLLLLTAIAVQARPHTRGGGSGNVLDRDIGTPQKNGDGDSPSSPKNDAPKHDAPKHDTGKDDINKAAEKIEQLLVKYHTIAYGAATLLGFIFTFVGYKLFPVTCFLAGASAFGLTSYYFGDNYLPTDNKIAVLFGLSCTCALIGGILACKFRKLGVFAAGASSGVVLAGALNSVAAVDGWLHFVTFVVFGLVWGVLAFRYERPIIIVATAITGSFAATYGTKYFVELSGSVPVVTWSNPIVWAYIGGFFAMVLAGVLIQFSSTNKRKPKTDAERRRSLLEGYPASINIETKSAVVYAAPFDRVQDEGKPSTCQHVVVDV